ncbi:MAG: glycosyltransferase family 39 protein [Nitrospiraceae bacterium]|nr:glycosyltransferase family 39 protein [Nitrospiraceae bacterium]
MRGRSGAPTLKLGGRTISFHWVVLCLVLLFVIAVRVRLSGFPLERDEGEYAYMGQLILQGVPPYSGAYNMKLPGTDLMYALIMTLFGRSARGIHLGFMIVNCATILLLYRIGRRFVSETGAVAAAAAYAVLSLSPSVYGFAAHATHFVVLPALGGMLVLLAAEEKERLMPYFWSGVLFGISFVMKQPGLFFVLFGVSVVLYRRFFPGPRGSRRTLLPVLPLFLFGAALPLLGVIVWITASGTFGRFWFWTVEYAARYAVQVPLTEVFPMFQLGLAEATADFRLLWGIALLGIVVMIFYRKMRSERVLFGLFALFSFLTILPGFYFRAHYFVTLLPAVSISVGIVVDYLDEKGAAFFGARSLRFIGAAVVCAVVVWGVYAGAGYYFREEPAKLSGQIYFPNPFAASPEIARYLDERTSPADRVAVFGSEPQIFFYANRRSASGYIYTYGLMEDHEYARGMQRDMVRQIEVSDPKFIVDVHVPTSWLIHPGSDRYIFGWFNNFVSERYFLTGVVDLISPGATVVKWGGEARDYDMQSPFYVLVYERK